MALASKTKINKKEKKEISEIFARDREILRSRGTAWEVTKFFGAIFREIAR